MDDATGLPKVDFECPLCGSDSFVVSTAKNASSERPIYKCSNCHLHFTDPARFEKAGDESLALRATRKNAA